MNTDLWLTVAVSPANIEDERQHLEGASRPAVQTFKLEDEQHVHTDRSF